MGRYVSGCPWCLDAAIGKYRHLQRAAETPTALGLRDELLDFLSEYSMRFDQAVLERAFTVGWPVATPPVLEILSWAEEAGLVLRFGRAAFRVRVEALTAEEEDAARLREQPRLEQLDAEQEEALWEPD
jgi:hypothetical protein